MMLSINLRGLIKILPILSMFLMIIGCASSISGPGLLSRIDDADSEVVVIDVRSGGEFNRGHLPTAVNIPVLSLPFQLSRIQVERKDQPLVVYCEHGPRAVLAGFILTLAGYANVVHLDGDMAGWRASNLPTN